MPVAQILSHRVWDMAGTLAIQFREEARTSLASPTTCSPLLFGAPSSLLLSQSKPSPPHPHIRQYPTVNSPIIMHMTTRHPQGQAAQVGVLQSHAAPSQPRLCMDATGTRKASFGWRPCSPLQEGRCCPGPGEAQMTSALS